MPDTRPQINIADAINSISQAYQNNKQGVLTKAYMQAQNQRANAELGLQTEHAQYELRAQGYRPPEELPGAQPSTAAAPTQQGPIAAAYQGAATAPSAPLPSVGGMPSPGRIAPMALAPPGQSTITPQPPMSAGDGTVAGGPGAVPATTPSTLVPLGGTGPHAHWVRDISQPLPQEQREIYVNHQSLLAANDAYAREHPGAPPLYTDAEIATGSRNPKAYASLVGRMEGIRDKQLQAQANYESLATAKDAMGNPLDESTKRSIANDPLLMRQFVSNSLNPAPPKEAKETPADREASEERVHKANRQTDAAIPIRGEGQDPFEKPAQTYINARLTHLMAPVEDKLTHSTTPGMSFDAAYTQASGEAQKRWPKWQGGESGTAPPPSGGGGGSGGNGGGMPPGASAEFDHNAALYQQALQLKGMDPAKARAAYDASNKITVQKYGIPSATR